MTTETQQQRPRRPKVSGVYADVDTITDMLAQAAEHYNLIGPLAVGEIPEGFSVVMSVIALEQPDDNGKSPDVYNVGGALWGLSRVAVERIAGAAGVSTVSSICTGQALNYCQYTVTVSRQDIDGSVRHATKSKTMDLREGSGQLDAMRKQAQGGNTRGGGPRDPDKQVREQRLHLAAHAETKAWLRAVRTLLGLQSFTLGQLKKPFAVPKLQFTGRSTDPELKRIFAIGLMQSALGIRGMMYGQASGGGMPELGAPPAPPQLGPPSPPPPSSQDDTEELPDEDEPAPRPRAAANGRQRQRPPANAAATQQQPTQPAASQTQQSAPRGPSQHEIKFGRNDGLKVSDPQVTVADLRWYAGVIQKSVDDPGKANWRAKNEADLAEVLGEIDRRGAMAADSGYDDADEPGSNG